MARGWESKAVESQIEAATATLQGRQQAANDATAAELSRQRDRESVELSRTRVLQDLARAEHPRYREMLQRSLAFLDEKLAALQQEKPAAKAFKHQA